MWKSLHGGRSVLALVMWCTASLMAAHLLAAQRGDDEAAPPASAGGVNWFLKGGDFNGQHYSPLAQVNAANVGGLGLAWAADLPIPDGVATTPIVIDGVVYLSGAYSIVLAVDAKSG
ncbi:MAG: PQQ-dependent dehydrogenase, methanol/ethanol family, partial [Gammaproteobacteria bacterium]|nr:PQQ-dependent dehydrogenase, methanol/ethanol family [Gammaproteobacteria bacterium]